MRRFAKIKKLALRLYRRRSKLFIFDIYSSSSGGSVPGGSSSPGGSSGLPCLPGLPGLSGLPGLPGLSSFGGSLGFPVFHLSVDL